MWAEHERLGDLFHADRAPDTTVVRRADQVELDIGPGVTRRQLHRSREHGIEVAELRLEPGAHTGAELGQEIVIAQEGVLTVQIETDTVELAEGDSLRLDAQCPHRLANNGATASRSLLVVSLPASGQYGH